MADYKGQAPPYSEPQHQTQQQYPPQPYNNSNSNMAQPQPVHHDSHHEQQKHEAGPPQASQGFQTATPIASLGIAPSPVDCPSCAVRQMTRIAYQSGNTTYAWALGLCACFCLGCIPFCMNSLKDVVHSCGHCGVRLATVHRSGAVEVHIHR